MSRGQQFAFVLLCALFWASSAVWSAGTPGYGCTTVSIQAKTSALRRFVLRYMDGEDAQRFLGAFNTMDPPSDYSVTRIQFGFHRGFPAVGVAFENEGCVIRKFTMTRQHYSLLMDWVAHVGTPSPVRKTSAINFISKRTGKLLSGTVTICPPPGMEKQCQTRRVVCRPAKQPGRSVCSAIVPTHILKRWWEKQ